MDDKTFKAWMKLFDAETTEILGDAKFAVEVAKIAKKPREKKIPWEI